MDAVTKLSTLRPSFMTVTFGAGGSTRDKTLSTLSSMKQVTDIPLGCHLTFISLTKTELREYLGKLQELDIDRIVALRGDMPKDLQWPLDPDLDYYQYTSDFIEGIKAHAPFDISVGAYPEKHPDAPDMKADIEALKKKCDAGANRAITQFFFDNDHYYKFLEETTKAGITTPIVPGLLPIGNYEKMVRFANSCKALVPGFIREQFEGTNEADHGKIAEDILRAQIESLTTNGVKHLHFYTLNRADMLSNVLKP